MSCDFSNSTFVSPPPPLPFFIRSLRSFSFFRKKRKTWLGTISGTMSHWSGVIFRSGLSTLKESGWWKLMKDLPPADLIASVPSTISRHSNGASRDQGSSSPPRTSAGQSSDDPETPRGRKRTRGVHSSIAKAMALKERRETLSDTKVRSQKPATKRRRPSSKNLSPAKLETPVDRPPEDTKNWFELEADEFPMKLFEDDEAPPIDDSFDRSSVDDIISATRDSLPNVEDLMSGFSSSAAATPGTRRSPISSKASSVSFDDDDKSSIDMEKSDKENAGKAEIEDQRNKKSRLKKVAMSVEDEESLRQLLDDNKSTIQSKDVLHLLKKLEGRKAKREKGKKVHSLDKNEIEKMNIRDQLKPPLPSTSAGVSPSKTAAGSETKSIARILDRYQCAVSGESRDSMKGCRFLTRLMGRTLSDLTPIKSPFTGRMLKPFIRRDFTTEPLKLKLLREIVARKSPGAVYPKHPVDYLYVRPDHIPSINYLAAEFFWPGIDLSESLTMPDFSCVAMYRKIVIGFAFLVPDVTYVEAYISFIFVHPEWRRAGIAKFMLYHLIQTCMGKDVTLHVSATNPAVLLYQKFGFKVEEYINNFYEKYLPAESKDCKNALFLRLPR